MRSSDWSADVCASDLSRPTVRTHVRRCAGRRSHTGGLPQPSPVRRTGEEVRTPPQGESRHPARPLRSCQSALPVLSEVEAASAARLWLLTGDRPGEIAQQRLLAVRSEEHTSALQSLMRISYALFCLKT